MTRHVVVIENVSPSVDGGLYPAKAVVGQPCMVSADILRDGHGAVAAQLLWRVKATQTSIAVPMRELGNDRFGASFVPLENAPHAFTIEAWADPFATWLHDFEKRVRAGEKVASEVLEGVEILSAARRVAKGDERLALESFAAALLAARERGSDAWQVVNDARLLDLMQRFGPREHAHLLTPAVDVWVDRTRASFSSWYELFPRSQGKVPGQASTLREAAARLPDVARMGFDVVYLPPVHPIGTAHRKGKNNSLVALPGDPGSPWAIGNKSGGHTAIEPALGTLDDFDYFVRETQKLGMEVALDYALQCSPDHPWVKEHPEWFYHRPDGTIKYAENPPKKYQDVYPINFDTERPQHLWSALRDIVTFWIAHGVKIFRVDNPHTKPLPFWAWLIAEIHAQHPDVIFLAEAFTRPKLMNALAKLGFAQSYTYFTWRNSKAEIEQYLTELTTPPMRDFFRPNFWPNTPDILPPILQLGGRAAFMSRLVLAATLSPSYGIYSGYELCENEPIYGREEYLHSEKYEVKVRDWRAPGNLVDFVTVLNRARREHKALQMLANLTFLATGNDSLIAYAKVTSSETLLVVVNLDPHRPHEGWVNVPWELVRRDTYLVLDLLTVARFGWRRNNFVRLDTHLPAHVLVVE